MRFVSKQSERFILCFKFSAEDGFDFHFGWAGFWIFFGKQDDLISKALENLPSFPPLLWPCEKCGSDDEGQSCNMEQRSHVTNCSKCSDVILK